MIITGGQRRLSVVPIFESIDFTGLTENPLSQSGRWRNGAADGTLWHNMRSISGRGATGTQGTSDAHPPYDDSHAVRVPPTGQVWSPNQDLQAKVFIQNQGTFGGFHEIELLLRWTINANSTQGYEVLFSVGPTNYVEIVRWRGPLGQANDGTAFVSLAINNATAPTILNNHYIRASIVGTVITAYHKALVGDAWTSYLTYDIASDSEKWGAGGPGIGNWDNGAGNPDDYGIATLDIAA